MVLSESSPMNLKNCALRHFTSGEVHITRVYSYSVLILMMDGVLRFCENGTLIELKKGEYYIQRANCFQNGYLGKKPLRAEPGELPVYYFLEFDGGCYSETDNGISLRGTWDSEGIHSIKRFFEQAIDGQAHANQFLLNSYMYRIFGMLYTSRTEKSRKTQFISTVRDYIGSHYTSVTLLDDMCKHFGYTREYLFKLFLQEYQVSMHSYLQMIRMEQALWILQNTNTPITQIPRIVGYANYTSFYRTFLGYYGITPSDVAEKVSQEHTKTEK